jgi:hypothetical protein
MFYCCRFNGGNNSYGTTHQPPSRAISSPLGERLGFLVVGVRHAALMEQSKQELAMEFKQEHSLMHRKERQTEEYDLQGSFSDATKPDMQRPNMDSDSSKACGEAGQKGSGYTSGYAVSEGAWPNIDFRRGVTVHLETTNAYGLHLTAPLLRSGVVGCRLCD